MGCAQSGEKKPVKPSSKPLNNAGKTESQIQNSSGVKPQPQSSNQTTVPTINKKQ